MRLSNYKIILKYEYASLVNSSKELRTLERRYSNDQSINRHSGKSVF